MNIRENNSILNPTILNIAKKKYEFYNTELNQASDSYSSEISTNSHLYHNNDWKLSSNKPPMFPKISKLQVI